jgi:cobalt-zinc-cadmium efflux system membrane fusion protein
MKKPVVILGFLLIGGAAVAASWFLIPLALEHFKSAAVEGKRDSASTGVGGYIELTSKVVELNGIKTAEVTAPTRPRVLTLRGTLALDPSRLIHVHSRFAGQIVEFATRQIEDPLNPESQKKERPLGFMDDVKKGDILAVVWSRELGEKKSELHEALIRLWTDEKILERLGEAYKNGAVTEREMREQTRLVDVGRTAVRRARRTLRAWFLDQSEIDEVEEEARRIHSGKDDQDAAQEKAWPRVYIRAEIDGTIVEKNAVQGDIVDTDDELFKINDLSQLIALMHVYEEDLEYLTSLPKSQKRWKLTLNSNPAAGDMEGYFDRIGDIIDVNEHMGVVVGPVPNPNGELIAGQFLTAKVELPPELDVAEIPTRALVEDGDQSVVLVQIEPDRFRFASRTVLVVRRYQDVVYVRSRLTPAQKKQGLEELHEGERIVSVGALELRDALLRQRDVTRTSAEKE